MHKTSINFPDGIHEYLMKTSVTEERSVTEIVMDSIRLYRTLRAGELYVKENGVLVKVLLP